MPRSKSGSAATRSVARPSSLIASPSAAVTTRARNVCLEPAGAPGRTIARRRTSSLAPGGRSKPTGSPVTGAARCREINPASPSWSTSTSAAASAPAFRSEPRRGASPLVSSLSAEGSTCSSRRPPSPVSAEAANPRDEALSTCTVTKTTSPTRASRRLRCTETRTVSRRASTGRWLRRGAGAAGLPWRENRR